MNPLDKFKIAAGTVVYRAVETGESGWPANKEIEVVAAITAAAEAYGRELVEQASERFDDEVLRHWGIHSDHDEIKEAIFLLAYQDPKTISSDNRETK